jgi:hypothetical protein
MYSGLVPADDTTHLNTSLTEVKIAGGLKLGFSEQMCCLR